MGNVFKATAKISKEEKTKISQRVQKIVNQVQVKELSGMIEFIDQIIDDPQKCYYVTIDQLDEDWVDDTLRYRLIKSLIETVRDFRKVRHAKIIIAIRLDLLGRVYRATRDSGFQEEKYETLYLHLTWNKQQLTNILNERIHHLIKHSYTRKKVTYKDILPMKVGSQKTIEYILGRTMMRPRDVILFLNQCIREAIERPNITVAMISTAEGEYSRSRLSSLYDEWYSDYPNLKNFINLVQNKKKIFLLKDIMNKNVENSCLNIAVLDLERQDILSENARQVIELNLTVGDFRRQLFLIFYKLNIIGIKLVNRGKRMDKVEWATSGRKGVSAAEVGDNTGIAIHPMFWRVLGIKK